jgi:hypothetical protein
MGHLPKSRGICRTRGEGSLLWLLGSTWRGHSNLGHTPSLHVGRPLLCYLRFETWLLPKGRYREGEGDRMDDDFCMAPSQKVCQQKWHQNNPCSNGWDETSSDPLLLTIKVTYIILKNKQWKNWPQKPRLLTICIKFYCDIKPTSKIVVSLAGRDYSLHYVVRNRCL